MSIHAYSFILDMHTVQYSLYADGGNLVLLSLYTMHACSIDYYGVPHYSALPLHLA